MLSFVLPGRCHRSGRTLPVTAIPGGVFVGRILLHSEFHAKSIIVGRYGNSFILRYCLHDITEIHAAKPGYTDKRDATSGIRGQRPVLLETCTSVPPHTPYMPSPQDYPFPTHILPCARPWRRRRIHSTTRSVHLLAPALQGWYTGACSGCHQERCVLAGHHKEMLFRRKRS